MVNHVTATSMVDFKHKLQNSARELLDKPQINDRKKGSNHCRLSQRNDEPEGYGRHN